MKEYLSPSIGQMIPKLDQLCKELTRQSLIRALTDYTKELCEYDPELADILLEGKKTLPRCIRYVTEQAQKAAQTQAETKTVKEMAELSRAKIHGQTAAIMGIAISDQEVYDWAKAYYYGGDQVEPADMTPSKPSAGKGKAKSSGAAKGKQAASPETQRDDGHEKPATKPDSQLSLFGSAA